MKGFEKNVVTYNTTGKAGDCPFCHGTNVIVEEHHFGRRSLSFRCPDCGKGDHFDGAHFDNEIESV